MVTQNTEGYWWSKYSPEYTMPIPNVLTEQQAKEIYKLIRDIEAKCRQNIEGYKTVTYRGLSKSRITGELLGCEEFNTPEWKFPADFGKHYVLTHRVKPSDEFLEYLGYSLPAKIDGTYYLLDKFRKEGFSNSLKNDIYQLVFEDNKTSYELKKECFRFTDTSGVFAIMQRKPSDFSFKITFKNSFSLDTTLLEDSIFAAMKVKYTSQFYALLTMLDIELFPRGIPKSYGI